jgi:Fe-S cluster assembly iron-binding protein IscA
MLQISDDAVAALRSMGPLRISAEDVDGELELSLQDATEPAAGDEVVEHDGARVFLDPLSAEALADQVLGVQSHGDHFHFTFDDQPAD